MTVEIRRVVTGVNAEGQALVIQDGLAPTTVSRPALAMEAALIWTTSETPADLAQYDDPTFRPSAIGPTQGGSLVRVTDFLPSPKGVDNATVQKEFGLGVEDDGDDQLADEKDAADRRNEGADGRDPDVVHRNDEHEDQQQQADDGQAKPGLTPVRRRIEQPQFMLRHGPPGERDFYPNSISRPAGMVAPSVWRSGRPQPSCGNGRPSVGG